MSGFQFGADEIERMLGPSSEELADARLQILLTWQITTLVASGKTLLEACEMARDIAKAAKGAVEAAREEAKD